MGLTTTPGTYVGIADCHGIESLTLKDDTTSQDIMYKVIRADANRHRHAVYFETELDTTALKMINGQLDESKYMVALSLLKALSLETKLPKTHAKSWDMIPNPDLDPYY